MTSAPAVRVVRSSVLESVHEFDVAVANADGELVAWAGDPARVAFARSSMKPLQATVSLSFAPFDFADAEIAVMCASHNAEPVHLQAVRSLMARAGVKESELRCPSMRPWDEESAAIAPSHMPINSDCSGKHSGMLAACHAQGWPAETYRDPDHPLQREILRAVVVASGLESILVGVDGCGVPVHGMPLRSMATIYARLSWPDGLGPLRVHAERALAAMRAEPYFVAGRNRVDTAVMDASPDLVVKAGAEGMLCAAAVGSGVGVAIKVRDGSARAAGPALIRVLQELGALDDGAVSSLAAFLRPPVLGGGRPVGELSTELELTRS